MTKRPPITGKAHPAIAIGAACVALAGSLPASLGGNLSGTLWTLKRKRAVLRVIIVANACFTAILLTDVAFLLSVLSGSNSRAAVTLLADVALIAASNILIFSIWYWIIDPPGVIEGADAHQSWAFLFPQRSSVLPRYESWMPDYVDYLFIAFTTSSARRMRCR